MGFTVEHKILNPVQAEAPYALIQNTFPINIDKELTDKDRVYISAMKECAKHDMGEFCINDLMGMAWTESRFDCNANGDGGASHGCFQIHLGYHKHITQEQARDTDFAVKWTLDRMINYKYPEYRSNAVMRHNGTPGIPATLAYLNSVNNY